MVLYYPYRSNMFNLVKYQGISSLSSSTSSNSSNISDSDSNSSISSSSSNNNKDEELILDPSVTQFSNQVGGHCAILSVNGKICKPLIQRELNFYLAAYFNEAVRPFVAGFHGVVDILKNHDCSDLNNTNTATSSKPTNNDAQLMNIDRFQPETNEIVLTTSTSPININRLSALASQCSSSNNNSGNRSRTSSFGSFGSSFEQDSSLDSYHTAATASHDFLVVLPSVQKFIAQSKQKKKAPKHPVGTVQQYILLEDLTKGYNHPCIVDIKVGTRQKGAICASTTSTSLGIRICGMKIFSDNIGGNIIYDRFYGRSLTDESLESTLYHFFFHSSTDTSQIYLVDCILDKLLSLKDSLCDKNNQFSFKLYSSSLLIIYEGSPSSSNSSIDMFSGSTSSSQSLDDGEISYPSLLEESDADSCISTSSDIDSTIDSSDNEDEINQRLQPPSSSVLRSSSSSSSSSSSIRNDVKMIDFAHAINVDDKHEASEDDGYIFGLDNLVKILANIKLAISSSTTNSPTITSQNNNSIIVDSSNNNSSGSSGSRLASKVETLSLQHHQSPTTQSSLYYNNHHHSKQHIVQQLEGY
ncbi:InsP6 kinase [Heterostelium album PN500]|uniref:Kinase n=1 Tax=Heterostelium pallidum (strain ATCC 26659 / Pp 5 / PN500) TaxID=670386 RepID=D3B9J2_HETP5|nr:InsP6 kinase [Heterostelium album PN500]EFA81904.1 InsP6 kinase [Heterostelium album PN500]|eukprot:XP_020434021.1 InsP6 kinase [Heterostelium album PN500]